MRASVIKRHVCDKCGYVKETSKDIILKECPACHDGERRSWSGDSNPLIKVQLAPADMRKRQDMGTTYVERKLDEV